MHGGQSVKDATADERVLCNSFMMEYDIHTVLDLLTLVATLWVIYELRFPLADTYQKDQDTIQSYYVVRCLLPAALLSIWDQAQHLLVANKTDSLQPVVHLHSAELLCFHAEVCCLAVNCMSHVVGYNLRSLCKQAIPCLLAAFIAHPSTRHAFAFRVRPTLYEHLLVQFRMPSLSPAGFLTCVSSTILRTCSCFQWPLQPQVWIERLELRPCARCVAVYSGAREAVTLAASTYTRCCGRCACTWRR